MARRNSTSKKSLSRNYVAGSQQPTLLEAIETERGRLSQAQSLLECLHLALENADESDSKSQVYFPDVVEVVLTLVRESVNRLDSIYIRPLVDAVL